MNDVIGKWGGDNGRMERGKRERGNEKERKNYFFLKKSYKQIQFAFFPKECRDDNQIVSLCNSFTRKPWKECGTITDIAVRYRVCMCEERKKERKKNKRMINE